SSNIPDRVNISAVVEPTNTFTLGAVATNKKQGTATVPITVPNPGTATLAGQGIVTLAHSAVSISSPGTVTLGITPTGKKKKKLRKKGRIGVTAAITYTPTGGNPSTQSVGVTLRQKKKKR